MQFLASVPSVCFVCHILFLSQNCPDRLIRLCGRAPGLNFVCTFVAYILMANSSGFFLMLRLSYVLFLGFFFLVFFLSQI